MTDIEREQALELLRQMVLIRRFEEKSAELYTLGKIRGCLHLYIGEEAVAVGALSAVEVEDNVVATYREHGQALVRGTPPGAVMAEMYGKANGCSRGRGGSMHLFDVSRRLFGGSAIVGAGLPLAVGLALADKLQAVRRATVCFFGDGAVDEGEFHESLNLAALWQLPVLFVCENNQYAMGTALERHQSMTKLSLKPAGYGIVAESVDGMDVLAVRETVERAALAIRERGAPRFVEAVTYRFRAHSMYDAELYRDKDEVRRWMTERDPIELFVRVLRGRGWLDGDRLALLEREIAEIIERAVAEAEAGPLEPVEELLLDVYTEGGQ